jgi:hypothetical protein
MTGIGASRSANGAAIARYRVPLFLLAAGIVLGLFGPFGTYQALGIAPRVLFWLLAVLAIGGINIAFYRLAAQRLAPRRGLVAAAAIACIAAAVPGTLLLRLAVPLVLPDADAGWPTVPALFLQVLLVNLCLTGLGVILNRPAPAPSVGQAAPAPGATWRERLPADLRDAQLLALEAEDHYLRVHTAAGSTLILLRLGDAIAELGSARGVQVHRSWWVARDAVERVERAGEKVALILPGGMRVPVSRGNRGKLAEMGWT